MVNMQPDESTLPVGAPPDRQPENGDSGETPQATRVDVDALARRVFELMKREVTIERERSGRRPLL